MTGRPVTDWCVTLLLPEVLFFLFLNLHNLFVSNCQILAMKINRAYTALL